MLAIDRHVKGTAQRPVRPRRERGHESNHPHTIREKEKTSYRENINIVNQAGSIASITVRATIVIITGPVKYKVTPDDKKFQFPENGMFNVKKPECLRHVMFEQRPQPRPVQFRALNEWDYVASEKLHQKILKSQIDLKCGWQKEEENNQVMDKAEVEHEEFKSIVYDELKALQKKKSKDLTMMEKVCLQSSFHCYCRQETGSPTLEVQQAPPAVNSKMSVNDASSGFGVLHYSST
ncbi:hypothetical protein NDU88_004744 [Pleurodeles waltl]|uniref:Uncharacterized protein n=1 Tax=Pleurodeles waltl TaxID=8319 RepID=A0AAV7W9G2_PLEWA|nr:hypothetical protein NDU88_004744 [Pleurodeles waltl]